MAVVPIRYGLAGRKVRASLKEYTGAAADLSTAGTIVTLFLKRTTPPYDVFTRRAVIDGQPTAGTVYYALVSGDFQLLVPGVRWWAWWHVRHGSGFSAGFDVGFGPSAGIPPGSDTGEYPEGDFDVFETTI